MQADCGRVDLQVAIGQKSFLPSHPKNGAQPHNSPEGFKLINYTLIRRPGCHLDGSTTGPAGAVKHQPVDHTVSPISNTAFPGALWESASPQSL